MNIFSDYDLESNAAVIIGMGAITLGGALFARKANVRLGMLTVSFTMLATGYFAAGTELGRGNFFEEAKNLCEKLILYKIPQPPYLNKPDFF